MADLALSGLASGFDWQSVVDQLTNVERAPQRRLLTDQLRINQRAGAVSSLVTELESLKSKAEALSEVNLFSGAGSANSSNEDLATASASTSTPLGQYKISFTQRATAAVRNGDTDAGGAVDTSATFTGAGGAGFAVAVTAGFFTINGQQITIDENTKLGTDGSADTDTLIYKINNSGAGVTATYDAGTDKITLTGGSNIVLGGAGDTSNFLQAARLNNGESSSSTIVSSRGIGGVSLSASLSTVNFSTSLSPTSGDFKINGVSIVYTDSDAVVDILERISNSAAGVTAAYDSANDQFLLTNNSTGDVGISLEDTTGNFLAATKLLSGTTTAGLNAKYTINGGSELESLSNTITEISHGVTGLIVDALSAPEDSTTTTTTTVNSTTDSTGTTFQPDALIDSFTLTNNQPIEIDFFDDTGYRTGDYIKLINNGGTLPNGVDTSTTYFIRTNASGDTIQSLHLTAEDAANDTSPILADTNTDINDPGAVFVNHVGPGTPSTTSSTSTSTTTTAIESGANNDVTITVGSDNSGIKKAITDFVDQYNRLQSIIDTQTASSTDAEGKVSLGVLATDTTVSEVARTLRAKMFTNVDLTSSITRLESIGFETDGDSNKISLENEADLDTALSTNKNDLKLFFTDSTNGLANRVEEYLESVSGIEGTLVAHEENIKKESTRIDDQIESMEEQVQVNRQRQIDGFIAMETAQAQINQQMQFLSARFG